MLLHNSKNTAIQQWHNSMFSSNLSNIKELNDGVLFLQMLNEYGYQNTDTSLERRENPLDITKEANVNDEPENAKVKSEDDSSETAMDQSEDAKESDDLNKVSEDANKESGDAIKDSEDAIKNSEDAIKDSKDAIKESEEVIKESEDVNKESEDVNKESEDVNKESEDVSKESEDVSKESEEVNKESEEVNKESDVVRKEPDVAMNETDNFKNQFLDVKNESTDVMSIIEPSKFDTDDIKFEVIQRYKLLKEFIDDIYHIESDTLIDYEACMESSEFELAKVSVFVLSALVKVLLASEDEKINTLTLLDYKVQEDIQECLTLFFQDFNNISKKDIHNLLSKHAKYKISPRKRNPLITPQRNCSSKYRKSVTALSPSADDIFSDSPLKSFLDSPQLKNQVLLSKDKELLKTRRILHEEEVRSEDFQLEINSLKKKLEQQDKEMMNLKKNLRERDSVKETENCESCSLLKTQLESANKQNKDLEDQFKLKEEEYEREISRYIGCITRLEGKIKTTLHFSSFEHLPQVVLQKEEEITLQKQKIQELEAIIEELNNNISKAQLLYEEKLGEIKVVQKEAESPVGECIGSVIEEENEILRTKLYKAETTILNLLKQTGMDLKDVMDDGIKEDLNHRVTEESFVSRMPDLIDISDAKKDYKLKTHPKNSQSSSSNSFEESDISNSFSIAMPEELGLRRSLRRKSKVSVQEKQKEEVPCNGLGSLWAQYNDSNSEWENGDKSNNSDSLIKLDLYKQLGFKKTEYIAKRPVIKKLFNLLNEIFVPKGTNGCVGLITLGDLKHYLKWEEDYVLCLYYIRESLFKFQNHSISKDYSVSDQVLCSCDSTMKTLKHLKKEEDELKVKISEFNESVNIQMEQKEAQLNKLLKNLEVVKQQYKEISKATEKVELERNEFCTKSEVLQCELNKIEAKYVEYKRFKDLYNSLLIEKNENIRKYNKQIKICRERIVSFDAEKRELEAVIEKEKKSKKRALSVIENLKFEIASQKVQKKNFEKEVANMKIEHAKLYSYIKNLEINIKESYIKKKAPDKIVSCTFNPVQGNARPQDTNDSEVLVQNSYKIELEVKEQRMAIEPKFILPSTSYVRKEVKEECMTPEAEFMLPSTSYVTKEVREQHRTSEDEFILPKTSNDTVPEVKLQDVGNESTLSGALFNKSLHSGLLLCTDDEEGFLNHSSIAEIKKDYECEKTDRLQELKRRNTMYLPHMQSSYPIELQSTSPFNKHLIEHMKAKANKVKNLGKREPSNASNQNGSIPLKKRKISEVDNRSEAGSSKLPTTPHKIQKTFKTPSSLKKILKFRRDNCNIVKPKRQ